MSDITPKPIAVSPVGVAPTVSITAAAAPPATASAAEIPVAIANLSVGTLVTGTVLERGARGLTVLRTDKGTIKLYSPIPLKQGSTVTLQIQSVGAQVQLSILSIDGQSLAHPAAKAPPVPTRPDSAVRSAAGESPSPRSPATPGNAGSPSNAGTASTGENAPLATVGGDRTASDRGGAAPRSTAGQTPASGFVARPLIASTSAASLEVLAPAQAPSSRAVVGTTAVATAGATGVVATPGTAGAPTIATAVAPPPTPQIISLGTRFVASFAAPPQPGFQAAPKEAIVPPPRGNAPAASLALSAPTAVPAAPTTPAAPASAPSSADHVILRLLGMAVPSQGSPPGNAPAPVAGLTAKEPQAAAGLSAASNAVTTIGTIIADGEQPKPSSGSSPIPAARTLINTQFGVLAVAGAPPGPVGTKLLLELVLRNDTPPPLPDHGESPTWLATSAIGRGQDMPALRGIMAALQTLPPDIADHLMNLAVPRPGPQLAAELLFFVAALRQGSPRSWLGDRAVDALQHGGHGALIDKLSDEFTGLARLASEPSPSGWQTLLLPLFDGERLQQIRLYLRRPRRKADGRQDGTRFMIEAELSKFGPVQLDGLVSKPQFDLVVRTKVPLPRETRGDIIDIFSDALLATNLKGAVSFQASADIRPGPPTSDDAEAGIAFIV